MWSDSTRDFSVSQRSSLALHFLNYLPWVRCSWEAVGCRSFSGSGYISDKSGMWKIVASVALRRTLISTIIVLAVLLVVSYPGHSQANGGSGPSIGTPITTPSAPGSGDQVTVNVTVTSTAGVQSVMVVYTTDNWVSVNQTVSAPYVPRFDDYQAVIPAQPEGTHVGYYVVAVDVGSNRSVNNNSGSYYSYTVGAGTGGGGGGSFNITSTSLWLIAAILGAIMVGMVVVFKRRSSSARPARK
jgi:hypothetical protein